MSSSSALLKAEWQGILFAEQPKRIKLLGLSADWELKNVSIRIHRNHSYEMVEGAAAPYFSYSELKPEYIYSDYDDSLTFKVEEQADVELLWLDLGRYKVDFDLNDWLLGRISFLKDATKNPILAVFVNGEKKFRAEEMPGLYLANIDAIQEKLGEAFFDLTKETFSGTRLSNKACTLIARELGTRWLPAIVNPTIKGLILDLDNTLYNGVLGEDGIDGIRVTKGHQALQQYILTLKEKGLFITICSRNEEADVLEMLNKNPDFQIKLSDLSAHRVNWNSKSQNIIEIAQELRVAPDALLLIDDNAGELVEVTERLSAVRTIHAKEDPLETLAALTYFPNLFKWGVSEEDEKRVSDLKTSKGREQLLSEATTPEAYLRKLGVTLILEQDIKSRLLRIAEMSQKTNQFNLNFKRYSAVDIENICSDTSYSFVTCSLKDNLSDSGVISIIVVRKKNDRAIVEELCVSCRALGRRLEDTLLMKSFELAMRKLHCTSIAVEYQTRERNQPGLKWLAKASNTSLEKQGVVTLPQLKVPFEDVITIVSPDT